MKQKTKSQRGFSTVELLIILFVVAAVSFIGWMTLRQSDTSSTDSTQQTMLFMGDEAKEYVDSAEVYSLQVPRSWTITEADDCCGGEPNDDSIMSRNVTITPANVTELGRGLSVQADTTGTLAPMVRKNWADNNHNPEEITINGLDTAYVEVVFKGDAEQYTDHQYLITSGDTSLYITFREKYDHETTSTHWDNSKFLEDFSTITYSAQLLE